MFARKIHPPLAEALEKNGIEKPFPIQKLSFSKAKSGGDLICSAPATKGKSTVLAICLIHLLKQAENDVPRAIVTVPDANAAHNIKAIFDKLAKNTDLRIFDAHLEVNTDELYHDIYAGSDIVIATPARFAELYTKNILNLSGLKIFALDDADMISKLNDLNQINRITESSDRLQLMIFMNKKTSHVERYIEKYAKTFEIIK